MSKKALKASEKKSNIENSTKPIKGEVQIALRPINIEFLSIIAERNKNIASTQIQLQQSINLNSFTQHQNPKIGLLNFSFKINYIPDFGSIHLKGDLILDFKTEADLKNFNNLFNQKKLPIELAETFHNFINQKCTLQCASLAKDLSLPPPFPIPSVKLSRPDKSETKIDKTKSGIYT